MKNRIKEIEKIESALLLRKHIAVIDLEATFGYPGQYVYNRDITEIGWTIIDIKNKHVTKTTSTLVNTPTHKITKRGRRFNGITPAMVESAPSFEHGMRALRKMKLENKVNLWLSFSEFDIQLLKNRCKRYQIPYPLEGIQWIDLQYYAKLKLNVKTLGLNGLLKTLGMEFKGSKHRAGDDAYNSAKALIKLLSLNNL